MTQKIYFATMNWQQDYPEFLEYMQPFIDEWERIMLESQGLEQTREILERIKNGNYRKA